MRLAQFLGLRERREKVSHVTVSVVWMDKGKGVTCYDVWGSGGGGESVTCYGFWGLDGTRGEVSRVTVSGVPFHCIHCIALLFIALLCFALICFALLCIAAFLLCIALHCFA